MLNDVNKVAGVVFVELHCRVSDSPKKRPIYLVYLSLSLDRLEYKICFRIQFTSGFSFEKVKAARFICHWHKEIFICIQTWIAVVVG